MGYSPQQLKNKSNITRVDIANLLKSIGEPGEKRDEKTQAVESLNRTNRQGHNVSLTLSSYLEW